MNGAGNTTKKVDRTVDHVCTNFACKFHNDPMPAFAFKDRSDALWCPSCDTLAEPAAAPIEEIVQSFYGCTECKAYHFQDEKLFKKHVKRQSGEGMQRGKRKAAPAAAASTNGNGKPAPVATEPAAAPAPVPAANPDGLTPLPTDDELPHLSTEGLKGKIEKEEEAFFPLYSAAAALEAKLTALKQQFDKDNADLITKKKLAVEARDKAAGELKTLAKVYGRRTGEKQFDQYLTFRVNGLITWDEPIAIEWLKANFSAALNNPGVTVDGPRFTAYIKDCIKKKQALPPSVKITEVWETLISSKIPVTETEVKQEVAA